MKNRLLLLLSSAVFFGAGMGSSLAQGTRESRTALVIGVSNYEDLYFNKLEAPEADAKAVAEKLKALGFDVTLKLNATRREMLLATDAFGQVLAKRQGVGLFYFSGHGSMKPDEPDPNYLIPAGAAISSREDLPQEAFNAQRVANRMKEAGNRLNLIFLDACRDNTLPARSKDATGGLAPMRGASGLMFFFATQPNQIAIEDRENKRSLFTHALLQYLATPGLGLMDMMADVTAETEKLSAGGGGGFKQSPFMSGTLSGRFAFAPGAATSAPAFGFSEAEVRRRVEEELARRPMPGASGEPARSGSTAPFIEVGRGSRLGTGHAGAATPESLPSGESTFTAKATKVQLDGLEISLGAVTFDMEGKARVALKIANTSKSRTLLVGFDWNGPPETVPISGGPAAGSALEDSSGRVMPCVSVAGLQHYPFNQLSWEYGLQQYGASYKANASRLTELGPAARMSATFVYAPSRGSPSGKGKFDLQLGLISIASENGRLAAPKSLSVLFEDIQTVE